MIALKEGNKDEAQGLAGMSIAFLHASWEVVKKDVMALFDTSMRP